MGKVFVVSTICSLLLLSVGETCEQPRAWHLDRLDQEMGLDSCYKPNIVPRAKPVLYVIDSGVYGEHAEFTEGNRIIDGYNFQDDSWKSDDCSGHGTHVAAIAAGKKFGVAGSIPVDIVAVRILDCEGRGSCSSMMRAMDWVFQNHTIDRPNQSGVVVMSVGSQRNECKAADIAAEALIAANILVVAAAGNSAVDACSVHPASALNTLTVGAVGIDDTTATDTLWSQSNHGSCVNIYAPGASILSAGIESSTSEKIRTGTSMAAPMISGQALLIMAAAPELPVAAIRGIIVSSGSRGSLDRNIRKIAEEVRIARVPWKELGRWHSESVMQTSDDARKRPIDSHFAGDIVEIDLETTSTTKPPMHYIGQGVAKNITQRMQFALTDTGVDPESLSTECYLSPSDASSQVTSASSRIPLKMRCFVWSQPGSAAMLAVQLGMLAADKKNRLRTFDDGSITFAPLARVVQSSVKAAANEGPLTESIGQNGVLWLTATGVVGALVLVAGISILYVSNRRG